MTQEIQIDKAKLGRIMDYLRAQRKPLHDAFVQGDDSVYSDLQNVGNAVWVFESICKIY